MENMYDICIIGSGPAGMTLCNELVNSGKKICMVESGYKKKNDHNDALREVVSEGEIKIKNHSRERIVGGTSTTWYGLSAPMDPIDMERWPVDHEELRKYYRKTVKYGFPKYEDFCATPSTIASKNIEEKTFIAKIPAWNFGDKLKHIFKNKNIKLYTGSTVTHISAKKDVEGKIRATNIIIRDMYSDEQRISAKTFVLCAGGIENARLLLLSRDISSAGLGNEYDQVGRYIMNHPKGNYGIIQLKKSAGGLKYLLGHTKSGWAQYAGVRVRENMQKSLGILNSYARFEPVFPWTRRKGLYAILSYIIYCILGKSRLFVREIRIRNFMEMEARPENRIVLDKKRDVNGKEIPKIILNNSELDKKSLVELHRILGEEIKKKDIGILESDLKTANPWPINTDASHHLGGTIMGNSPRSSVVNKNLKVHSVENLYICGGSVFPTSGNANPTYTICALAIRLAEFLR